MEITEIKTDHIADKSGQGIVILALGSEIYGRFAVNLAIGLKKVQPEIKICLVHNDSSITDLDESQKFLFDLKVRCPQDYYFHKSDVCYVRAKLFLDKLSPFKETLFLDADMIWNPYRKPEVVFSEFTSLNFTMANRGVCNVNSGHSDWVDMKLMKENFGIEKWIDLSSEWIYFKQSEQTTKLFESARKYYDDDKLICKQFAGGKPDEPAFCLAMLEQNILPHVTPYYPVYWEAVHRHKPENDIKQNYYGISLGGKFTSDRIKKLATALTKHYSYHRGVPVFEVVSKSKYLKEREFI